MTLEQNKIMNKEDTVDYTHTVGPDTMTTKKAGKRIVMTKYEVLYKPDQIIEEHDDS